MFLCFPNEAEIKNYNKIKIVLKNDLKTFDIDDKPLKIQTIIETKEIVVTTENGYYNFDAQEIISIQFLK